MEQDPVYIVSLLYIFTGTVFLGLRSYLELDFEKMIVKHRFFFIDRHVTSFKSFERLELEKSLNERSMLTSYIVKLKGDYSSEILFKSADYKTAESFAALLSSITNMPLFSLGTKVKNSFSVKIKKVKSFTLTSVNFPTGLVKLAFVLLTLLSINLFLEAEKISGSFYAQGVVERVEFYSRTNMFDGEYYDNYKNLIEFESYTGDRITFSVIKSEPNTYDEGDFVDVMYSPINPEDASLAPSLNIWMFNMALICLSIAQ